MKFGNGLLLWNAPPPRYRDPISAAAIVSRAHFPDAIQPSQSLQVEALKVLDWPSVCGQLSLFTSTSMGLTAAELGRIPLGRTPAESRRLLDQTSAAVAIPRPLDFSGIEDVSSVVDSAVSGEVLSIGDLCSVLRTLRSVRKLIEQLEGIALEHHLQTRCHTLLGILQKCDFPITLEQKIEFCLDCNLAVVLDRASEDLELVRLERKTNLENLDSLLKHVSTQIFNANGIDKPTVTKRRSRMCVAVRTTHKSLLPGGVVLDSSNSGATYFMEPREAVDLNNLEVKLSESEKIEEQVVLSLLSREVAACSYQIKDLLDRVLEVDLALARAGHARWIQGVCPNMDFADDQDNELSSLAVDVKDVRHPVLLASRIGEPPTDSISLYDGSFDKKTENEESGKGPCSSDFPVPVDFRINRGVKVVVVSGPNTGGKTASLKTLGLISIMLKAGMYLPASSQPRLPWFDLVLADIGDNQSLEQSLSTFSGHISRICSILDVATEKSLILLDEIGSGTDPSEGVALSVSILQYLKDRVSLAVVTTHYADLTRLKEKSAKFENAAMEFCKVSLEPTYRILWGSMGESNALNIATTIGFDRKVIEEAKSWVQKLRPENMQNLNTMLYQSLSQEKSALEAQAERAASLRSDILELYNEAQNEAKHLGELEAAFKERETKELQQELKLVRTEIDSVIHEFEKQLKNSSPDHFNKVLKDAESALVLIVEKYQPSTDVRIGADPTSTYVPQRGDQVLAKGFRNKLATVVEPPADDNTVLIQCGKIRLRVDINSIKPLQDDQNSKAPALRQSNQDQSAKRTRTPDTKRVEEASPSGYGPVVQTSKNSLDLRGMRVQEASFQVEMAIAATQPNSVLFIIHGTGTGVLKEHVLGLLRKHPRVAKFEPESDTNYGCTIAYIQ